MPRSAGVVIRLAVGALSLATGGCANWPSAVTPAPMPAHWWQAMGDTQLSILMERGLAQTTAGLGDAQASLSAAIATRYIDLRAHQTALVLLAAREELDTQLVAIAEPQITGMASRRPLVAAQAQLAATQAAQARIRAEIAALRDQLTVLTGLPPGIIYSLPGGAIPLPPVHAAASDQPDYEAARVAEQIAMAQVAQARTIAALQSMHAPVGTPAAGDAIAANLRALDALQAEEQTRAAMTFAYVALVKTQR